MSKKVLNTNKKKKNLNGLLVLIGIALIAFAVIVGYPSLTADKDTTGLPLEVSVSEAFQMRESGAFVLDVREPNEWEAGHIPGATLIPLGELGNRMNEIPKDQEVLIVCRSGNRSAQARDILKSKGFNQVTSMAGGMNQWAINSYVVEIGK